MLRSTTSLLPRLVILVLAAGALLVATGCASDDDSTAAPATTTASQPAAQHTADASALDPSDDATLRTVQRTVARYCARHGASAGELTGAIATLEALYEIDPDARQADGTTVQQATVALERRLRACGAPQAARRVARLSG